MKRRVLGAMCAVLSAGFLMGAARHGVWLKRIPAKARVVVNPLAKDAAERERTAAGGKQLYRDHCAQCHGATGLGVGSRPEILSERVAGASDGELFWLMTNGDPYHGMPAWQMLPATQRWQLVAYVQALNAADMKAAGDSAAVVEEQKEQNGRRSK
jgi:mono/diheme cytochrome c family protein